MNQINFPEKDFDNTFDDTINYNAQEDLIGQVFMIFIINIKKLKNKLFTINNANYKKN
jgi:hypothetical protein